VSDDERDNRYTKADLELAHLRGYIAAMAVIADQAVKRLDALGEKTDPNDHSRCVAGEPCRAGQ
jgi:hypothetical protein